MTTPFQVRVLPGQGNRYLVEGAEYTAYPSDKAPRLTGVPLYTVKGRAWHSTRFEVLSEFPAPLPGPLTANDIQIGGEHYKGKAIQPWDYITSNELGYLEGNVVKYVSRWKDKNGVADLEKAAHYITKLIELQKGK